MISPISLLLFSGDLHVQHKNNAIVIDGRIQIRAAAPIAVMFKKLRRALDELILHRIENPEFDSKGGEHHLLEIVKTLLSDEEHARKNRF